MRIKYDYLCSILLLTCRLNGYKHSRGQHENENEIIKQLLGTNRKNHGKLVSFDVAVQKVGEKQLLEVLAWFEDQLKFSIEMLNQTEKLNIGNRKKVASILESL